MTDAPPETTTYGWTCVEQLDMTGMAYSQAKPLIESLVAGYEAQGRRVKIVSRAIVEIHVSSDA